MFPKTFETIMSKGRTVVCCVYTEVTSVYTQQTTIRPLDIMINPLDGAFQITPIATVKRIYNVDNLFCDILYSLMFPSGATVRLSTVRSGHFLRTPDPDPDPRSGPGPVRVRTQTQVLQCNYFKKNYLSLIFIYI